MQLRAQKKAQPFLSCRLHYTHWRLTPLLCQILHVCHILFVMLDKEYHTSKKYDKSPGKRKLAGWLFHSKQLYHHQSCRKYVWKQLVWQTVTHQLSARASKVEVCKFLCSTSYKRFSYLLHFVMDLVDRDGKNVQMYNILLN